jgi:hypothetical protein
LSLPYDWYASGFIPWRWVCRLIGHKLLTDGWHRSPHTTFTHFRRTKCARCSFEVNETAYMDARTGQQPDDAMPTIK